MALPRLRAVPAEDPIRDVRTDPRIKAPLELLGAFEQRYELLRRARLRLGYEAHFAGRLPADDSDQDRPLRAKLRELQSDPPLQPAPARTLPTASPAIRRGLAILQGEKVEPAPTISEQITEIDRLLGQLSDAIREQRAEVDERLADVAAEFGRDLLPIWNDAQIAMYRAFQEASRATTRFRELKAAVMQAGILTEVLRHVNVRSPLILGAETDYSSEISHWRRTLEDWRVL